MAKFAEFLFADVAGDPDAVNLVHTVFRVGQLVGEIAVSGQEQKSACVVIQTSYREYALLYISQQINYCEPAFIIGHRGDDADRFIHGEIDLLLAGLQLVAFHLNYVTGGHIISGFIHGQAVDLDLAGLYQLIRLAPAGIARAGNIFIYPHFLLRKFLQLSSL